MQSWPKTQHMKWWNVISHTCPDFNGGLVKSSLNYKHRWVVISNRKQWIWSLNFALISVDLMGHMRLPIAMQNFCFYSVNYNEVFLLFLKMNNQIELIILVYQTTSRTSWFGYFYLLGIVTDVCIMNLGHYCFKQWLVIYIKPILFYYR